MTASTTSTAFPAARALRHRATASLAGRVARWRGAPALHPAGVRFTGTLAVVPAGPALGEPWLDRPGRYRTEVRWSRAAGVPEWCPDGLGLALRVIDAGGPGRPLDLLFTTSGGGRRTRHLPLARRNAMAGPYSTLLSYRVGTHRRLLALTPAPGSPRVRGDLAGLRQALRKEPLVFVLCTVRDGEPWRALGTLTTGPPSDAPPGTTSSYDPYLNALPGLRPTSRLSGFRESAYAGSRAGRSGLPPRPVSATGRPPG
ncbi:phosphodiesterase [Streptomyces sp. MNU89]|uniref:phosphodiesterase n=1 Tax=Streptomyces sp. MNU89 TaxID=2560025 RepID=UPI001E469ECD|nr:phosphodiesterase [Streptomyces sp. MNU89]MCC9738924.1 phosphodiesterase [Streptomyces sp. MNU89]